MIRAIRLTPMCLDDPGGMLSGWNVAPAAAWTLTLAPSASACAVMLWNADMTVLIATGAAVVGTDKPVILMPQSGQTIAMQDDDLGWHMLLTTTGTEPARTIRLDPVVDLPDEVHPLYQNETLALARATAVIDAATHYLDEISITCPMGLGAGLGALASADVDGVALSGQVESITWTGTPDGYGDSVTVRRYAPMTPAAPVAPQAPPAVTDDAAETDAATSASGNVLDNDDDGLTVVAVEGLGGNVGVVVTGTNGGEFVIGANGAWTFDPSGDFAALTGTDTATTSITYHASDGTAEAMGTLTVTVTVSAATGDPYWVNTGLCINTAAGVQDANSIIDAAGKTISVYGNSKFDFYDGYMSIFFDGAGDYLTVPSSADFDFGAGDFTIEVMLRLALAMDSYSRIWNPNGDYVDGLDITLSKNGNNALVNINMSSNGTAFNLVSTAPGSLVPGVWTYLALAREGGTAKLALNSNIYTLTTGLGTTPLYYRGLGHSIGGQAGASRSFYGHIRGMRITKGVARDITVIPELPFLEG